MMLLLLMLAVPGSNLCSVRLGVLFVLRSFKRPNSVPFVPVYYLCSVRSSVLLVLRSFNCTISAPIVRVYY
jgi:hypothetical protein